MSLPAPPVRVSSPAPPESVSLPAPPESVSLPPIELLLTVDEETGLTGAFGLEGDLLDGRILLNLDSEDWEEFYVGCAGGGGNDIILPIEREEVDGEKSTYKLSVTGLRGGHSGVDIHEERANAIKLLARILRKLTNEDLRISSIEGGDMHNAIPREAFATIYFDQNIKKILDDKIQKMHDVFSKEYGSIEDGFEIKLIEVEGVSHVLNKETESKIIGLLNILPHGVMKMSHDVPGLVETSNNIASIKTNTDVEFMIHCSTRSSLKGSLDDVRDSIKQMSILSGATCTHDMPYPGWKPDMDSNILKMAKEVYLGMYGNYPLISAIHAGLECGVIGEKVEGMDMLSFGPTIKNPHSPDECVQISTVSPFWDFLLNLMISLSKENASAGI